MPHPEQLAILPGYSSLLGTEPHLAWRKLKTEHWFEIMQSF